MPDYYNKIKESKVDEPFTEKVDEGDTFLIKKWNPACIGNRDLWKHELMALFPKKIAGDVYHLVYFKDVDGKLQEAVNKIKISLNNQKEKLKIQTVWLGKNSDRLPLNDYELKGRLKTSHDYDYLLMIQFDSKDDLKYYYENSTHSRLRHELYQKMDDSIDFLYSIINKTKDEEVKSRIFESTIEELVSKYMVRQDFIDQEDIEAIVDENPYRFPYTAE